MFGTGTVCDWDSGRYCLLVPRDKKYQVEVKFHCVVILNVFYIKSPRNSGWENVPAKVCVCVCAHMCLHVHLCSMQYICVCRCLCTCVA